MVCMEFGVLHSGTVALTTVPQPIVAEEQWWDILSSLGPVTTLAAACIAAVFAWRTLSERRRADQRAQWWTRTQWALDAALSGDPDRREMGLGVLELLARSDLAGTEENEIISIAWAGPLADRSDIDDDMPVDDNREASKGSEVQQ